MSLLPLKHVSPSRFKRKISKLPEYLQFSKLLHFIKLTLLKLRLQFHRTRLKTPSPNLGTNLILKILLICHLLLQVTSDTEWCYDGINCGPTHWGGICASGKRQSPINIPTAKVTSRTATNTRIILNRNYALPKLFFVKNTGHTLQLSINADDKSKCFLLGDGLGKKPYYFSQLHFHWGPNNLVGSEHRISGKSYPLELHMVHRQLKDPSKIAVLSILFYLSPNDNPALTPVLNLASKVREPGSSARTSDSNKITLTKLFPKKMRMFRYAGSLTTPPCSESVVWTVFRDPVPVSSGQMGKFRKLLNIENRPLTSNYRPVQPTFTSVRKNIYFVRQLKKSEEQHEGQGQDHNLNGGHYYGDSYANVPPHPGVYWGGSGGGYGFGEHYHPTHAEWEYWHPVAPNTHYGDAQFQYGDHFGGGGYSTVTDRDDFELDFYQADQWIDLASII